MGRKSLVLMTAGALRIKEHYGLCKEFTQASFLKIRHLMTVFTTEKNVIFFV